MTDEKEKKTGAAGSGINENNESVIRETIKQRPVDRRKVFRNMLMTVLLAVLFGAVASVTFYLLEPVINRDNSPEQEGAATQVTLPEADYEITPDKMYEDDKQLEDAASGSSEGSSDVEVAVEEAMRKITLGIDEYRQLNSAIRGYANQLNKSVVTVTAVRSGTDWLNNTVESENEAEGVIVAVTDTDIVAAVNGVSLSDSENVNVTFCDGKTVEAELLDSDSYTGISVVSVGKSRLTEETLGEIRAAVLLSNENANVEGRPVIAFGSLTGTPGATDYGIVSSADRVLDIPDSQYRFLMTDMNGNISSNGVLFDFNGNVLGFITNDENADTDPGVITAISSASVKSLINRMTNREPGAVLGIHAIDVPEQAVEEDGVPEGIAVTQVEVGSPAMEAGIRSGDIIVSARGTGVSRYSEFLSILESAKPGDTLTFTAMRPGNEGYESTRFEAVLGSTGQE